MKKFFSRNMILKVLVNISIVYFLVELYHFTGSFLIASFGLNRVTYSYIAPFLEESFRFISIWIGGIITYLFTFYFAIGEYMHYIEYYKSVEGSVPVSFYIFRAICVLVHVGLLVIQLMGWYLYKKSPVRQKKTFWIVLTFIIAVFWHILYNNHGVGAMIHRAVKYVCSLF